MTDSILTAANPDMAPLTDGVASTVSAGTAAAAGSGAFSNVLGERLQAAQPASGRSAQQAQPPGRVDGKAMAETGTAVPPAGKALPLSAEEEVVTAELDQGTDSFIDAAFIAALQQSQAGVAAQGTSTGAVPIEDGSEQSGSLPAGLQALLTNAALVDYDVQRASAAAIAGRTPQGPVMIEGDLGVGYLSPSIANGLPSQRPGVGPEEGQGSASLLDSTLKANSPPPALGTALSDSARLALQRALATDTGTAKTTADGVIRAQSLGDAGSVTVANGMRSPLLQTLLPTVNPVIIGNSSPVHGLDAVVSLRGNELLSAAATTSTDDLSGVAALAGSQRIPPLASSGVVPQLPVATPLGQPGWASEVGQHVMMMAKGELREAQLQLHPRSLGPVEVRIVYGHDHQLNVSFSAANPVARDALDAALPRLREMFDQQGLNLANTDISHESFAQQEQRQHAEAQALAANDALNSGYEIQADTSLPPPVVVAEGLLDAYA